MKLWILPLGGKGLRVKNFGKYKPLIKIKYNYIIEWFLIGLKEHLNPNDKLLVIILKDHDRKFSIKKKIYPICKKFFKRKNIIFKILNKEMTSGPAETVLLGIKELDFKKTTIVANHDQFIKFEFPNVKFDAFIPVFFNNSNNSSYVKIKNNSITSVVEKKRISFHASSGIYGFKNLSILKSILNKTLKLKPHFKNEFFIGPSINFLIKQKKRVVPTKTNLKLDLGTTMGINYFKNLIKFF